MTPPAALLPAAREPSPYEQETLALWTAGEAKWRREHPDGPLPPRFFVDFYDVFGVSRRNNPRLQAVRRLADMGVLDAEPNEYAPGRPYRFRTALGTTETPDG